MRSRDLAYYILIAIILYIFSIFLVSASLAYDSSPAITLIFFYTLIFQGYTLMGITARKNGRWDPILIFYFSFALGITLVLLILELQRLLPILILHPYTALALVGFALVTIIVQQYRGRDVSKRRPPSPKPKKYTVKPPKPPKRRPAPPKPKKYTVKTPKVSRSKIDRVLTVILLIALIVSICLTVYIIVIPKQGEKFTEFYLLGMNGTASDYPTDLTTGEVAGVIIGVVNNEYTNTSYLLEVKINETTLGRMSIDLTHNETWKMPFEFSLNAPGKDQKMEFLLYTQESDEVYRSLHLWIDVAEGIKQEETL
ncbi:MAG: DUF1616 domain-containing protein [Halobacteriota archaeon]|nr:DUF1616 domain-containing protein [Halobacteriota archaeon]